VRKQKKVQIATFDKREGNNVIEWAYLSRSLSVCLFVYLVNGSICLCCSFVFSPNLSKIVLHTLTAQICFKFACLVLVKIFVFYTSRGSFSLDLATSIPLSILLYLTLTPLSPPLPFNTNTNPPN
jgi:hypothetical protein